MDDKKWLLKEIKGFELFLYNLSQKYKIFKQLYTKLYWPKKLGF